MNDTRSINECEKRMKMFGKDEMKGSSNSAVGILALYRE